MPKSMPPSTEDFTPLRRLLALMNHEAPPPGYFDGFSGKVIARIQAGDAVSSPNWWERLLLVAWGRPWATAAAAVAALALVVAGVQKVPVLQPALADADPLLSAGPAVVQAAMLEWHPSRDLRGPTWLPASSAGALPTTLGASRLMPSISPRTGAVVPASFTPAY